MDTGFVPLNPRQARIHPPAQEPVPLKPAGSPLSLPSGPAPLALPGSAEPKPLTPTFKDLYLQKREELRKGAEGMEAMLVRQVMKAMRSTIPTPDGEEDDLFGSGSHATQMFTQMMDDEFSEKISQNGDFGIADRIFKSQINILTQELADQLSSGQERPFGIPIPRR
ncbi:rod-binding protein [bacterium]|nr:rod-binding protein [bacterium]